MSAYYNEIDPYAAQWLRNLIAAGHIAPGDVDERSIVEVRPDDLRRYVQCHFFAGIGVWSHALRSAGWSDDRPVWTGSCPCQPFSAAGKGDEFADERHLWPVWFRLIRERRPVAVFGEQVASKDALAWLDHVSTDLEGEGYTVGAVDTCAAGFGAPHIRQRLWFVADTGCERVRAIGSGSPEQAAAGMQGEDGERKRVRDDARQHGALDYPADPRCDDSGEHGGGSPLFAPRPVESGSACSVGDTAGIGQSGRRQHHGGATEGFGCNATIWSELREQVTERRATGGFWGNAEWLRCLDGKARPVEPGTFPLAHGAPARVGRLRAYGNAINAEVARHFIESYRECLEAQLP